MYTGIVQTLSEVTEVEELNGLNRLKVAIDSMYLDSLTIGASIAIDGVCLTVTEFDVSSPCVHFDVMQQTLSLTSLGGVKAGDHVNVERSASFDQEIGGHLLSGHIDSTVRVIDRQVTENNVRVQFEFDKIFNKYLFNKGFVALNGCSLTLAEVDKVNHTFDICYIPETLTRTNHGLLKKGALVNMELDRQTQTIVDTVERVLKEKENT